MQQHPIPQNVTAYEFHLIGNMTIKQFLELGTGIGIGVFFYATALPDFIKWPIIIFSVMTGGALAFLPFDGRPLDRMVIAFFKAVYSPTQYIWRKEPTIPRYFNFTPKPQNTSTLNAEKQRLRKNLNEYLSTLPTTPTDPQEEHETRQIHQINQLFKTTPAAAGVTPSSTTTPRHSPKIRIRKIKKQPQIPNTQPVAIPKPPQTVTPQNLTNQNNQPIAMPQANTPLPSQTTIQSVEATQNQDLPFPDPPQTPNTLVGMVLTNQGKIIENAIIEVTDQTNNPQRALKTNKLGQFFSATPLQDGQYNILIEKQGHQFPSFKINLTGELIGPLEIRATT